MALSDFYLNWGQAMQRGFGQIGDAGQTLVNADEKNQEGQNALQAMIDRRATARAQERRQAMEDQRAQDELDIRRKQEERAAAATKEWKPQTMEEAIQFETAKAKAAADAKGPKPKSESEIAREQKSMQAKQSIPAVWSRIEGLSQQLPREDDPRYAEAAQANPMDPMAGQKLYHQDVGAWQARVRQYQDDLNKNEVDAGLPATKFPLGNVKLQDIPSYKLYRGGGASAPEAPIDADTAAERWLANPANADSPARAGVMAQLAKKRGLPAPPDSTRSPSAL